MSATDQHSRILHVSLPIPLVLFPLDEDGIEYWAATAAESVRQQLRSADTDAE